MTTSRFTRRLDSLRRTDVAVAGGKAANLGEMMAAGLPVPPGFVVTVDAFRATQTEAVSESPT